MPVNINNAEEVIIYELGVSAEESRIFIHIVKNGRVTIDQISSLIGCSHERGSQLANSLVNNGMIIEIKSNEYECLHPRFAITNRYRKRCEEDNIVFKKNSKIDNIGLVLETPYNNARNK